MDLATVIKGIVRDYLENENMSDVVYGAYTGSGLKIDGKPEVVSLDFIDVPKHLTDYETTAVIGGSEQKIILKNALKSGDRVAVVRKRGGQRYMIVDRL